MDTIVEAFVLNIYVVIFKTLCNFGSWLINEVLLKENRRILMILNGSLFSNIHSLTQQIGVNAFHI